MYNLRRMYRRMAYPKTTQGSLSQMFRLCHSRAEAGQPPTPLANFYSRERHMSPRQQIPVWALRTARRRLAPGFCTSSVSISRDPVSRGTGPPQGSPPAGGRSKGALIGLVVGLPGPVRRAGQGRGRGCNGQRGAGGPQGLGCFPCGSRGARAAGPAGGSPQGFPMPACTGVGLANEAAPASEPPGDRSSGVCCSGSPMPCAAFAGSLLAGSVSAGPLYAGSLKGVDSS
eukprot:jgi/Botrbrau1/832/Bobra.0352s0029.1